MNIRIGRRLGKIPSGSGHGYPCAATGYRWYCVTGGATEGAPCLDLIDRKGVHCVRRATKAGAKFRFYAWRVGPEFWEDSARFPNDPAFFVAFAEATARPKPAHYMTVQMVDDFLSSAEMPKGERTRQDYRLWALRFSKRSRTILLRCSRT